MKTFSIAEIALKQINDELKRLDEFKKSSEARTNRAWQAIGFIKSAVQMGLSEHERRSK